MPRFAASSRRALETHGPAIAGYVAVTIVFLWPVLADVRSRIISDGTDAAAYLWYLWQIPRDILAGDYPFQTHDLFFPIGARTAFNTGMPLVGVLTWPLQEAFGLAVAANLSQLLAVVLSAAGAYFLALHVGANRLGAFLAGLAFGFMPYRFIHLGPHYSLTHTEFLPFGLLALLRLYERPDRGRAVVLGLAVAGSLYTDQNLTTFLLLAFLVVAAGRWRATFSPPVAARLAQAAGVAAAVSLPLTAGMVRELADGYHDPLPGWGGADIYSADLLSWVVPASVSRLWAGHFGDLSARISGGEGVVYPGAAVLLLATAGGIALWRAARARTWVALAVIFGVLSLGPFLHVNGWTGARFSYHGSDFSIPLPYFAFHFVPVLNSARVPGRFGTVAVLALTVLAALALTRLQARRPGAGRAVAVAAIAFSVVEFAPAFLSTQPAAVPRPYHAIAADPDPGAVLEVPLQWRTGFGAFGDQQGIHTISMYYATVHGRPLADGSVSRYPSRRMEQMRSLPVYRDVVALQSGSPAADATFDASDLRALGIAFVVSHRDKPRPAVEEHLERLGLPVLADDGVVVVRKVEADPGHPAAEKTSAHSTRRSGR